MPWLRLIAIVSTVAGFETANAAEAPSYAALVRRTEGLLLYWPFDEPSKRDGLSGIDSGFAPLGKAIRLSGGHMPVADLGTHDAVSVEIWLKLLKPAEGIAAIYAADNWSPGLVHLNLRANGTVEFAVNGAGTYPQSEAETLTPGRWAHLVATYDRGDGTQRLFCNGRMVQENTLSPRPAIKLVAGAIGAWINNGVTRPLPAEIDEVAIYSQALSLAEVRSHYHVGRGIELKPVDFASDVRPILAQQCFACHGSEKQENGLRLDIRDAAFRGGESGEPAIAAFDSDGSHLIARITSRDAESAMPPEGPRLTETQIATLKNWIDQGAPWPDELAGRLPEEKVATTHWSFQPIKKIEPPDSDDPFVTTGNAIDAFIFARLKEHQLSPSPPADPKTLLRRRYLDLHGLPPTPEAEHATVDELLASPRYGERWASHWLDVVRYGDTHGFEVNTPRENAWPYR
jgi:hypothetical protein